MTELEHKFELKLTKDIPCLVLKGEIRGSLLWVFGENRPCYNIQHCIEPSILLMGWLGPFVPLQPDHIYQWRTQWVVHALLPVSHIGQITINNGSIWGVAQGCKLMHCLSAKANSCHDANFVITGGTKGCHHDNLWCHQWWQSWHHDHSALIEATL